MSQETLIKDTMGFAQSLLESLPGHLDPEKEATVEALSRKVDVIKKVVRSYDSDWKKPIDETALDGREMEALVEMFLYAASTDAGNGGDETGKRLKWLNSAYNALDLASALGVDASRLWAIRNTADSQLETLLSA